MPVTPNKSCRLCKRVLTRETYCPACQIKIDARKKTSYKKYNMMRDKTVKHYGWAWQKLRKRKMKSDSLCEECLKIKRYVNADLIHHIKPVELYPELELVWDNLQSLCNSCHEKKHRRNAA